jgi:small subunit ribosomal protein S8e
MATKKGRKISGGKYIKRRKKKLNESPGQKKTTKLGETRRRSKRTVGGGRKVFLLQNKTVNVPIKGKVQKLEIKNVVETPSNRFLARQNIITKGTIVETESGRVKISNRPTQEGVLNGILIE